MSAALEKLAGLIRRETGITLKPGQLPSLAAAVRRVDPALDAAGFLELGAGNAAEQPLLDRLIDEVTVNETFFFRQRRELDAIDWRRLHQAARAGGSDTVRVWVAACASGEEAYTLALLASQAFAPLAPPVSVLGTDISAPALDQARRGRYGRRALRALDPQIRKRYFTPAEGGVVVGDALRELVEFRRHNLVLDPAPTGGGRPFDLIACRNVLIYFDAEAVERVIDSLESALALDGTLLLGAADRLCDTARRLARLEELPAAEPGRRAPPRASARPLRRPLGRDQAPAPSGLAVALRAANEGGLDATLAATEGLLQRNPLDADAHFVRGLTELGSGEPEAAVRSLRRALYVDPTFGLAAFQLGRAHEERGDPTAAMRAYEQALHTLETEDPRHDLILEQVDLADVADACAMRLADLTAGRP